MVVGGYSVSSPTLRRIFTLHYLMPFILTAMVVVHIYILHQPGSSSELGVTSEFRKFLNKATGFHMRIILQRIYFSIFVLIIFCIFCILFA